MIFSCLHVYLPTVSYLWDLFSIGLGVLLILLQQWLSSANCTAVFAAPHCGLDVAVAERISETYVLHVISTALLWNHCGILSID